MRVVKRLHLFILKSFLPLFAMTFFIVLFIVLMQFLWRYIDDLVGKGLSIDVIGELFFYAAVSMVPMALPLAILLASLMTFGNLGERFELTAMKSAGISLIKVMAPLIVLISGIAVGAFFFQNDVLPKAQVKMWTLLFSMRQKSPEVEIPVGVFYDQIPGINLFVSAKNRDTGMLYDVRIYDVRHGGDNVTILVSDSAHMALTSDMQYIYLYMYKGNQYEKMASNSNMRNDPFRRESFHTKEILIPFDNNFNRLDEGGMREQYVGKNLVQLQNTIDSVSARVDSLGVANQATVVRQVSLNQVVSTGGSHGDTYLSMSDVERSRTESVDRKKPAAPKLNTETLFDSTATIISFDSLVSSLGPSAQTALMAAAVKDAEQKRNSIMFEAETIAQEKKIIRRHGIELLKKFTLSVACLIFFFIGAPLGAIICKGGLGMPLVISVMLFLVYYIFDNAGYKMARDGHAPVWFGMWLSTFILVPLGIFVTYKAMHDSSVFDPDKIKLFFRRLSGKKEQRSVSRKEVIIHEAEPIVAIREIMALDASAVEILKRLKGSRLLIGSRLGTEIKVFGEKVDELVDYLHNSRNDKVIKLLNEYPVIKASRFSSVRSIKRMIEGVTTTNARILSALDVQEPAADPSALIPDEDLPPESEINTLT